MQQLLSRHRARSNDVPSFYSETRRESVGFFETPLFSQLGRKIFIRSEYVANLSNIDLLFFVWSRTTKSKPSQPFVGSSHSDRDQNNARGDVSRLDVVCCPTVPGLVTECTAHSNLNTVVVQTTSFGFPRRRPRLLSSGPLLWSLTQRSDVQLISTIRRPKKKDPIDRQAADCTKALLFSSSLASAERAGGRGRQTGLAPCSPHITLNVSNCHLGGGAGNPGEGKASPVVISPTRRPSERAPQRT